MAVRAHHPEDLHARRPVGRPGVLDPEGAAPAQGAHELRRRREARNLGQREAVAVICTRPLSPGRMPARERPPVADASSMEGGFAGTRRPWSLSRGARPRRTPLRSRRRRATASSVAAAASPHCQRSATPAARCDRPDPPAVVFAPCGGRQRQSGDDDHHGSGAHGESYPLTRKISIGNALAPCRKANKSR